MCVLIQKTFLEHCGDILMDTGIKKFEPLLFRRLIYSLLAVIMMMSVPNLDPIPSDSSLFTGSVLVIFGSSFAWQHLLQYALSGYTPRVRIIAAYALLFGALSVFGYSFYLLTTLTWYPGQELMNWGFTIRNLFFQMTASFLIGLICFVRLMGRKYAVTP
jgi:hypothetical protein